MTQRRKRGTQLRLLCVFAALLAVAPGSLALAQPPNKPQGSVPEQFYQAIERARRQVETLYVLRLSEALALNTEQSGQAAAVIRKAQEARRGLLEERRQMLQELNTLLSTGARAERIKPKLSQWVENEARLGRWRQGLFQDLTRILSPEQQGRFVLFDENFNNEIRNAVMELRTGGSQGTKE
ncbi:MAG: hypothetical protein HYS14_07600 [Candidatus Rokubacteria bacterium]|nr:hypothetical protein [Candidatus Rokubacteria bacterium]